MKRRKELFDQMIHKHQQRMHNIFLRAKNKTKRILESRSFSEEEWRSFDWKKIQEEKNTRILFSRVLFLITLSKDKILIGSEKFFVWIKWQSKQLFQSVHRWYTQCIVKAEYTKRDFVLFFFIAFFFGIGVKMLAIQKITIGFEDYTVVPKSVLYDMNDVQKKNEMMSQSVAPEKMIQGEVCREDDNL